ncbi:uncharacterized protein LOC111715304 [Eurytemora carolleeae]|uniref:uncharacterized protein LOC111715304 n=1 Tax=Eurytemora carolleeae TaxID=1294199 RepID=UPI000C75A676|nr:uncharacterized protein LOC111715304 [Eurytemora carolleeae]|eukprot:XP_023346380.1 uncharacterized protein LOC111715304 [Eurytemora affinis]
MSSMISEYGLPETADMMSGAIYMHASMDEDKCSQCLRLAETVVPNLNIRDLELVLESLTWWPTQVNSSLAAKELITSLDAQCIDRLKSIHFSLEDFTLEDQFRLCHLWISLIFQPKIDFPDKCLLQVASYIGKSSTPVVVSFLLLLSSFKNEQVSEVLKENSADTIRSRIRESIFPGIHFFSKPELLAAYTGMVRLGESDELAELRHFLENKFGFRLS